MQQIYKVQNKTILLLYMCNKTCNIFFSNNYDNTLNTHIGKHYHT